MAKSTVSAEARKALKDARELIEYVATTDGNEAETRRRVERIFENLMGYDIRHLSREHAIKGAGETEHADFGLKTSVSPDAAPVIIVELKRVGVDLATKHLKQVSSYAINAGCEWLLLTNGRDWRLYHVEFGQPPITHLVDQWNIFGQDMADVLRKFEMIGLKKITKGSLDSLWLKTKVLAPKSILSTILSEESYRLFRRILKRDSGVNVAFEDFAAGLRKLLNESAAIAMTELAIKAPVAARRTKAKPAPVVTPADAPAAILTAEPPLVGEAPARVDEQPSGQLGGMAAKPADSGPDAPAGRC